MEHVDLLPTLFGLLEWETHPNFQGLDVLSDQRPELRERAVYLHVNSAASRADAIIGSGRWKLSIDHETGREKLVDLAHDPQEAVDVSRQYPEVTLAMRQSLLEWRQQQLSYYTFPTYYTKYYPPRAPGVKLP